MHKIICRLSRFGFYNMRPAPAVQVFCYIPRIDHRQWVDFLIDTGADKTCLNGIHARNLQTKMREETLEDSLGVSGGCMYFQEPAVLIFTDENKTQIAKQVLPLGIQQILPEHLENPDFLECPCLFGRDVLEDGIFIFEPNKTAKGIVELFFP